MRGFLLLGEFIISGFTVVPNYPIFILWICWLGGIFVGNHFNYYTHYTQIAV